LGSTYIYPRDAPQPMSENCLLTSPLEYTNEPYAIAKIAGVKMCESYNLQYGTNFISVMPTNLYGPNDNFDLEKSHVLPGLLRKIHLGKCLEEGNWASIREDLHRRPIEGRTGGLEDEKMRRWENEKAILDLLDKYGVRENSSPIREIREIRNQHINIGTGKEIYIKDLAYLIKEKIGFRGELVFNTSKPDGTMRKLTDPSKIHSLGWHHKIEIGEGIEKLYSWYLKN